MKNEEKNYKTLRLKGVAYSKIPMGLCGLYLSEDNGISHTLTKNRKELLETFKYNYRRPLEKAFKKEYKGKYKYPIFYS